MSLTAEQIETWSRRPSSFFPSWTKTVMEEALTDAPQLRDKCEFEMYVQGSYANETNIHSNSDVDLVVQMQLPFEEHIKDLPDLDRKNFWEKYGDTWYSWFQFRQDVLARLRQRFFVHEANKCIDIRHFDSALRLPADIVPVIEYRRYSGFPSLEEEIYEEGIFFRDQAGNPIINFPKQHLRNGRRKDAAANRRFKPAVRVFKNARNACDGVDPAEAPSYFVECLAYNIPTKLFRAPLAEAYPACVRWLAEHLDDLPDYDCQNELVKLFGDGGHQWRVDQAHHLIAALVGQLA